MSYYGSWPIYKISNFRGLGEIAWKVLRFSWRIDRIALPLVIPPILFLMYFNEKIPKCKKELPNPYIEAYAKKMEEGKYNGSLIGLRPEKYA